MTQKAETRAENLFDTATPTAGCSHTPASASGGAPLFTYAPLQAETVAGAAAIEATVQDGWGLAGITDTLRYPAARCFVALRDTPAASPVVCAFAAFTFAADEANLDALSVAAAFRRQGAARGLLAYAFAALTEAGARHIFLEVRVQNSPARTLYRSLGFAEVGLRRGFYQNPADDAVIMEKQL